MKIVKSTFAALLLGASSLFATDFDLSGTFNKDDDVVVFNFSVSSSSLVTVFSSSWLSPAGGGFDPILAVWTSAGALIAQQDDGGNTGSTLSNAVSYNHGTWDSYYTVNLAAGNYIATVTQFDNFAVSTQLSDGFTRAGQTNFTFAAGFGGATQPFFNGVWDNNDPRTGNYAFHILNVETATQTPPSRVPDSASTSLLAGLAIVGLLAVRRRLS